MFDAHPKRETLHMNITIMLLIRKTVIRTISNKENNYSTRQERNKGPKVFAWMLCSLSWGCIQRRHWIALQPVQEPT